LINIIGINIAQWSPGESLARRRKPNVRQMRWVLILRVKCLVNWDQVVAAVIPMLLNAEVEIVYESIEYHEA
jgi:hypothetical protein